MLPIQDAMCYNKTKNLIYFKNSLHEAIILFITYIKK